MQLSIIRSTPDSAAEPTTLILVGSIDLMTHQALLEAGKQSMAGSPHGVCIDAGAVDFIDSVGISALIELEQTARRRGVPLSIVRPSARVQRVLDLVGLRIGESTGLAAQGAPA